MSDEAIAAKLDHIVDSLDEVKTEVKEIRDGAPIWRIENLEQSRRTLIAWLSAVSVAVVGSILTAALAWLLTK